MNHISNQSHPTKSQMVGNILSGQSLSKPTGLLYSPTRTSYTISELIKIANKLHKEGKRSVAEKAFRKVLEYIPDHPVALHFLGVIALEAGSPHAAIKLIKKALNTTPEYPQAYNNLGNAFLVLKNTKDAIDSFSSAIAINPDYADAIFNLGLSHRSLHEFDEAETNFETCTKLEPRNTDFHYELGVTYANNKKRMQAQICFRVVLLIDPDYAKARIALGNLFQTVKRYDESVEQYDLAIAQDKNYTKALNAKGVALQKLGKFRDSLDNMLKSDSIEPNNVDTLISLGGAYQAFGNNDKATEIYRRAYQLNPDVTATHKCLLYAALNNPYFTSKELYDLHLEVMGPFNKPELTNKSFGDRDRTPSRRLKVGYVSSDFKSHVVALNVIPLISNHDHDEFEIYIYSKAEFSDDFTEAFQSHADHWRTIWQKSDEVVAKMIEEDAIDILVILAGRFNENCPLVATYKPAPIQISFHDCATSGLEAMDYYFTDEILHPSDTQELFTEELYRLPYYYQYPLQEGLPEVKPSPALSNGFITFGCFNKPEKINDTVIELWADVLRAVPNSKLLLKYFNHYSDPDLREHWQSRFQNKGINEDRLILQCNLHNRQSHLALYDQIDISLDPFPFNGATTTYEALIMGLPVVTLLGKHFVDRVAASIVAHAGFPEFAVNTKDAYVELAQNLSGDIDALNKLRLSMRKTVHKSKLCDGEPYCRNVENAFREIWTTWCKDEHYKSN